MRIRLAPAPTVDRNPEENYLASVSDLMVGLLFVFLIMLMSFVLMHRKQSENKVQIINHLEQAYKARTAMLETIQANLRRQGTTVDIDPKNGVIRLKAATLFDSGEANLQQQAKIDIQRLALQLKSNLSASDLVQSVESVLVEGHTDNEKIEGALGAGITDNWDLSYQRAKQTYQALLAYQPSLRQLRNQRREALLSMSAYGEERPIALNTSVGGKSRNRRIDIRIILAAPETRSANAGHEPAQKGH